MLVLATVLGLGGPSAQRGAPARRNVIVFVADGLRAGSITRTETPTFWTVRADGVNFSNSHSIFPTLTMPNAATIATGHQPGDSGQFGNSLFPGFRPFDTGNFGRSAGPLTPALENNLLMGDLDDHFGGRYLGEPTLLELARQRGFSTAAVGKTGPTALQDVAVLHPAAGKLVEPATIILDSATGTAGGVPVSADTAAWLKDAGLTASPPQRTASGNSAGAESSSSGSTQQWFADALTKAILPNFVRRNRPFAVLFWSGEPDQTQHSQQDSVNELVPGINGPASRAAVREADRRLKQIVDYVNASADLRSTTDIFVTADHGFSTVSRRDIDREGHQTRSYSAQFVYKDVNGRQLLAQGTLPNNFLAVDLAHALGLPLYDSDRIITDEGGMRFYQRVDPATPASARSSQMPSSLSAVIGGTGRVSTPIDAQVIVTFESIYVLNQDRKMAARIVRFLAEQDYIGGIFVDDRLSGTGGALSLREINLAGRAARVPQPTIVVSFRNFATDPNNPLMTGVIVAGTQQQGQGNHGSLSRANTFNNMAAIGPDFKQRFVDTAPVSNADIAPTLASILGIKLPNAGGLHGRILREGLSGGPATVSSTKKTARSKPSADGRATILNYQEADGVRYLDEACLGTKDCN